MKKIKGGVMSKISGYLFVAKEYFFKYFPIVAIVLNLILLSIFYALVIAYIPTQNGDDIEHIHSSFLVAIGQVPYRDFFQHHNPLLWYIFAPLTKLFAYNSTITEVVCLISLFIFLKSLVYIYRIGAEFIGDKFWGLAAATMAAVPGAKLYAIDFRPDNYMVFCLMGGLYYYFSYLKNKKCGMLVVSFCFFFFSFMFAQKALFPLAILGCTGLYFWYKKEIYTRDMLRALIIPVIGLGLFFSYLFYYDMVHLYFVSNYTFNLNLVEGFELNKVTDMPRYMKWLCLFGWIGAIGSLFIKNRYLKVIALLFVVEFLQRRFYFSPYSYYYWFVVYLASLCAIVFWQKLNQYGRAFCFILIFGLYFWLYQAAVFYYKFAQNEKDAWYLPDYITRQITPCDYVFNGDGMMYNIFGKDPAYYWQLIGQLDIVGEQTGIRSRPNISKLIEEEKPLFIFGRNYFNKFATESGKHVIVHYVDMSMVEKYYDKTEINPIYKLKPEYRRTCKKNLLTGKWEFSE